MVTHEIPKNSDLFNKYKEKIRNVEFDLYSRKIDAFMNYTQISVATKKDSSVKKEEKSEKVNSVYEKSAEVRKKLEKLMEKTSNSKTTQVNIEKNIAPNKEQKQEGRIADKIKKVKEELNKIHKSYEEKKKKQ